VADHIAAVIKPLQVSLVRQRAQQVIRRRQAQPEVAGELLGASSPPPSTHCLYEMEGALDALDQRRRGICHGHRPPVECRHARERVEAPGDV